LLYTLSSPSNLSRFSPPSSLSEITGSTTKLSTNPLQNCAEITVIVSMKMLGIRSVDTLSKTPMELFLDLHNGLPLWSGSSAASTAAAAVALLGRLLSSDKVVEPSRAPLILGMETVKKAALEAGAFGCTITGAGPTAVAVIDAAQKGEEIGEKRRWWKLL
ncbi:hypothetical protein HID58_076458, partial [Brassica napus]